MSSIDYTNESPIAQLFAEFAQAGLPLNAHSNALAASRTVLSGPGYLTSLLVSSTNAAAQFIQLHDAIALPANGAVPAVVMTVAATADKFVSYPLPGRYFQRGIVVANSTTSGTLTTGVADCFFDAQFIPVVSG